MVDSSPAFATPRPLVALPCGSMSTSRTVLPSAARHAPRLTAVVVFPTPPFWLTTAMTWPTRASASECGAPWYGQQKAMSRRESRLILHRRMGDYARSVGATRGETGDRDGRKRKARWWRDVQEDQESDI
jgi:hypothetical protein